MKRHFVVLTLGFLLLSQNRVQAENLFATHFNGALNKIESSLTSFKQTWPDWAKKISQYVQYSFEYYFEFDNNIFLAPSDRERDLIQAVRQELQVEVPGEETFFFARFANTLPYYQEEDELVPTFDIETRFTYNPTEKLSLGISNQFFHVDEAEVGGSLGDLVLSLGYLTNTVRTEAKYELFENTSLSLAWNFDHINYEDGDVDFFIDRNVNDIDARVSHRFFPAFDGYLGYRFRDVAFDDLENKDSQSNILFTGARWKFAGLFSLFAELGYEERDFDNNTDIVDGTSIAGTARRHHDNVNYRIGFETNLSKFNRLSFYYDDHLYESSRSEFTNFEGRTVGMNLRYFLNNQTILFFDFIGQNQDFDSGDNIVSLFGSPGAETDVYRYSTTLRRLVRSWLHFDIGYVFTKRNTDFKDEDSKIHQLRLGFKATF